MIFQRVNLIVLCFVTGCASQQPTPPVTQTVWQNPDAQLVTPAPAPKNSVPTPAKTPGISEPKAGPAANRKPKPLPRVATPKPELSNLAIAKLLVRQSRASYRGNCACPYDTDRAGRRCGGRSTYSRPGGYSPLCFERDVKPKDIKIYRQSL